MGGKMIKKLNKYELDFNIAWHYVKKKLDKVNTLSNMLLKLVEFKKGTFFTYLPENAELRNLYDFTGAILPLEPIEESEGYGKECRGRIPSNDHIKS
jgi:hypothetical protein